MRYLGMEPGRPRVAVFDFTSCEGCELQLANKEETLAEFLGAIEIVAFREISTSTGKDYDIALIEGSITRADEVEHRDIAFANGAERAPAWPLLSGAIRLGCRLAIGLSERI